MRVYADNAATTKMSRRAINVMTECMETVFGNPSSLYKEGQQAAAIMNYARECIAARLGCKAKEITFTSGGSEADNQALLSAASAGEKQHKKHIISTAIEHHAVLNTLKALEQIGFRITLLPPDENGLVTVRQVEEAICDDTCLVSIMYANNEVGTIQPVSQLGALCREKGILFHTDAVQAAGHLPIDVVQQNIDLLSLSAHKFHGPKGAGVLYCRRGIRLENLIYGGEQERGKRPGTENVPAIVAMAEALDEACQSMDQVAENLIPMRDRLINELAKIPGAVLNGHKDQRLPGNINFSFEGIEGETLLLLLDNKGVCVSSGSACTSGSLDPSHVLIAMGRSHQLARASLRITLCRDNTDEEVDYIIAAVKEAVEYLRRRT